MKKTILIMPISTKNTSLICPCNDLESQTIIRIGERLGLDVHKIDGKWGVTLTDALEQIAEPAQLREHVIIVELPDHNKSNALQNLGKQVHVIDHHQYSSDEVATPLLPSSLEQFAALLDYKLSEAEYQIAINDRDFLPGLSKAGVSIEEAKSLRQEELVIRQQTDNMQAAKKLIAENKPRELHNLQFMLVPEQYAGVMLEAAQWPTDEAYVEAAEKCEPVKLKPTLILYHTEQQRDDLCQLMYAGPAKQREELSKLCQQWQNDFELWMGGGEYNCFLGAKRKNPFADVNGFVSELLNICLQMGRPLRHYGCTFYLPLDLFLEDDLAENRQLPLSIPETIKRHRLDLEIPIVKDTLDSTEAGLEKQAYLYFLPHLRDMVFDVKNLNNKLGIEPIKRWRLDDEMTMQLGTDNPIKVKLTDVSLYRYFNDTYMLTISVQPTYKLEDNSTLNRDDTSWWGDLFFSNDATFEQIAGLQLHHWLNFTKLARIIYPSFREQVIEEKITLITLQTKEKQVKFNYEHEISPIVLFLLEQFFSSTNQLQLKERLHHLPDDRMVVLPAYGLAGKPLRQEDIKRLFSLALYVDREADTWSDLNDYAYDPKFVDKLLEKDSLGRWNGLGNYSGCCAYANVYFGFGGFFSNVIAPSHVPYIYGRMLTLALFYQMALRHYNRRINYATQQLSENEKADGFQKLRKEFIRFTNSYWFREVSCQVQGIEIFDLQTKALRLEAEYSLIKDEMERADEYSNTLHSVELNNKLFRLTAIATIATTIATIMGATAAWPSIIEILRFFLR